MHEGIAAATSPAEVEAHPISIGTRAPIPGTVAALMVGRLTPLIPWETWHDHA